MKDGLRFVDSDMHIMEPPDLFDRYLDAKFKHRVSVPVGPDGRPFRGPSGLTMIDGLPTSDSDLQQYRKRIRRGPTQSTQPLSGSRLADTGRLDFAVERDYNAWIHEFCQYSPHRLKFVAMLPVHDVRLACRELVRCVKLGAVGSFIRP